MLLLPLLLLPLLLLLLLLIALVPSLLAWRLVSPKGLPSLDRSVCGAVPTGQTGAPGVGVLVGIEVGNGVGRAETVGENVG